MIPTDFLKRFVKPILIVTFLANIAFCDEDNFGTAVFLFEGRFLENKGYQTLSRQNREQQKMKQECIII